jgi:hypothetical protein
MQTYNRYLAVAKSGYAHLLIQTLPEIEKLGGIEKHLTPFPDCEIITYVINGLPD